MSIVISELRRYPLKSGAGELLAQASFVVTGIAGDRSFMLVNSADLRMITQRDRGAERLALIRTELSADLVTFIAPGCDPHRLIPPHAGRTTETMVHSSKVRGIDCGDQAAGWFSEHLRDQFPGGVRLLTVDPSFTRELNRKWVGEQYRGTTAFADGYPVLVTNQASLAELNQRIEQEGGTPVPMTRFRPNVVVQGLSAFAEDSLRGLSFPEYPGFTLRFVKPCERCPVTTIEQTTGVRVGKEPLTTLARFRRWGDVSAANARMAPAGENAANVLFGVNAVVEGLGDGEEISLPCGAEVVPIN